MRLSKVLHVLYSVSIVLDVFILCFIVALIIGVLFGDYQPMKLTVVSLGLLGFLYFLRELREDVNRTSRRTWHVVYQFNEGKVSGGGEATITDTDFHHLDSQTMNTLRSCVKHELVHKQGYIDPTVVIFHAQRLERTKVKKKTDAENNSSI